MPVLSLSEGVSSSSPTEPSEGVFTVCATFTPGPGRCSNAPAAAQVFIQLFDELDFLSKAECDICNEVVAEEDLLYANS